MPVTSTEFPMSRRLVRVFAGVAGAGMVCVVAALLVPFWTHGPTRAVMMTALLSGGLFLFVVGLVLHIRGRRLLARLRGGSDGATG